MKVLVTGGAGFIGSHLADKLIENENEVVVIDNLSTGNKKNVNPKAKLYVLDIRDQKLDSVFLREKPDFVFHQAAQIDVGISIENPVFDTDVNLMGTLRIFENCVQNGVKKIIIPSSAAVYGEAKKLPIPENIKKIPTIPYAFGKLAVEQYADFYSRIYNMGIAVLRYSNVYGPRQSSPGEGVVVQRLIDRLLKNEEPIIYGDGNQTRDFIFVSDVVESNLLAMEKETPNPLNISTSTETSINDLAKKIAKLFGKEIHPRHAPAKSHEVYRSSLANRYARQVLGWSPKTPLDEGLRLTISYMTKARKVKTPTKKVKKNK